MSRRFRSRATAPAFLLLLVAALVGLAPIARADTAGELGQLFQAGQAALNRGDAATADRAFTAAVQRAQAGNNPNDLGAILNNVGLAYSTAGKDALALQYLNQALTVKRAIGDPRSIGSTLLNLGSVYLHQNSLERAASLYQQALDVARGLGDAKLASGAFNNLGVIYEAQGLDKKAADAYLQAINLTDVRADPAGSGKALLNLAHVYLRLGQVDEAVQCFQRSLASAQARGDAKQAANTLDTMNQIYGRLQKWDKAVPCGIQAAALMEKAGTPRELAGVLNNAGVSCMRAGEKEKAVAFLSRAVEIKRALGSAGDLASSLSNLALLYYDLGKLDKAAQTFAAVIQNDESLAARVTDAKQLGKFQEEIGPNLYNRYTQTLVRLNKPDAALETLERGRGQGLAKQAAQNRGDYARWVGPADAQKLRAATAEFQQAAAAWREAQGLDIDDDDLEGSPLQRRLAAIHGRVIESQTRLGQLRKDLAGRYPAFQWMLGAHHPSAADLKGLAAKNPDTLFIAWGVGQESTTTLHTMSAKDGFKGFVLEAGEKVLREKVSAWRAAVASPDGDVRTEEDKARALYTTLFSDIEKAGLLAPGAYSHLMLVGDGPLLEVPWAALLDGNGKRLVERYSLSTAVSFGMLLWPREDSRPKASLLCAADPLGGKGKAGALPAARAEGQAVAALFPGATLLVGGAASKPEVQRRIADYGLLHFATHGYLDPDNGFQSGLVLAPEKGSDKDALLLADEISTSHLAAQLAVLSACETGQGQKSGGEGLLGLTWAFRAAGCPSVVASQWSVDDAATGKLMVGFYNALKAGKRKDDALREAMLAVKSAPTTAKPYFWAAFQVFGDTSELTLR